MTLKYGKLLEAAFERPGGGRAARLDRQLSELALLGADLQGWARRGASGCRATSSTSPASAELLADHDDAALGRLMTNLAGHDIESVLEAFHAASDDDVPTCFIAYTIKGFGLPFAGHKDNHAGLLNPTQMASSRRDAHRRRPGVGAFAGLRRPAAELQALPRRGAVLLTARRRRARRASRCPRALPRPTGKSRPRKASAASSTPRRQARAGRPHRHLVARRHGLDQSRRLGQPARRVRSPQRARGRLPRREGRLDLQLGARRRAASTSSSASPEQSLPPDRRARPRRRLFGARLLPVGTLYDPFISAASMRSTTPATRTRASCWWRRRPASPWRPRAARTSRSPHAADRHGPAGHAVLRAGYHRRARRLMRCGLEHMQATTAARSICGCRPAQPAAARAHAVDGAGGRHRRRAPTGTRRRAGRRARDRLHGCRGAGGDRGAPRRGADVRRGRAAGADLARPAACRLAGRAARRGRTVGAGSSGSPSPVERLLAPLSRDARLVTVIDGHPLALSWLGRCAASACVRSASSFGQSGDIPDLYRTYGLDTEASSTRWRSSA